MNKPKILVVEDEESIRRGLTDLLLFHGFDVEAVNDGESAIQQVRNTRYNLIILDVMLPIMDGFNVCSEIRKMDRGLPIIMLTAKAEEEHVITGFSLGADDYITKPFSVSELVFRVKAVLRRSGIQKPRVKSVLIGDTLIINVDTLNGRNSQTGEEIEFTRREVDILIYLQNRPDRGVSRGDLLSDVWGYERASQIETRTVDIHIAKLRRKIEKNPKDPLFLVTLRGEGYSLRDTKLVHE